MKFINLLIFIILLISLYSCNDSLGVDPKVVRVNLSGDTGSNNNMIKADNFGVMLKEVFKFVHPSGISYVNIEKGWENYYRILEKNVTIDTTNSNFTIHINFLSIKSIVPDSEYTKIPGTYDSVYNKIIYFEIKADSIPGLRLSKGRLDGQKNSKYYCLIKTKSFTDNSITDVTGQEMLVTFSVAEVNKTEKYILINFIAEISTDYQKVNNLLFDLIINY